MPGLRKDVEMKRTSPTAAADTLLAFLKETDNNKEKIN
jgi:hypothetical protein